MFARLAVLLSAAAVAAGCINSATLVTVKPDGSGTIDQTTLVNPQTFRPMLQGLGAQGAQGAPAGPVVNEDDLRRAAERMGGVTYVSAEPMKGPNGFEGVKAHYTFADINTVRVSQDPHLTGATSGFKTPAPSDDNALRFALTRAGDTSTLVVSFPDTAGSAAAEPAPPAAAAQPNPQMLQMIKSMFDGFKVAIDLDLAGTIVTTDADYVTGSRIALLEMDLTTLLQNEAKLEELQSHVKPGMSISEVKPYLKDVKGIRINNPVVTVTYR